MTGGSFSTVLGSGVLVQTLLQHALIDTYRLMLHPLVLDSGKRLFQEYLTPLQRQLTGCVHTSTGVVLLTYERVEGTASRSPTDIGAPASWAPVPASSLRHGRTPMVWPRGRNPATTGRSSPSSAASPSARARLGTTAHATDAACTTGPASGDVPRPPTGPG
jgi:hypothetical protein